MKKNRFIAILFVLIFLLSGCSIQNTDSMKNAAGAETGTSSTPSVVEDGTKEITVAAVDFSNIYNKAAIQFEKETGVKVKIINYLDESLTQEEVYKNLEEEVMSGKSDIFASGDWYSFDYNKYGRKKHFCDLKEWITKDDYFKDKFQENILTSGIDEEKIYAIPLQFSIEVLGTRNEIPEIRKLKNPTWEQFMNTGKDLKRNEKLLITMYDFEIFENRFRAKERELIDLQNKTQKLDSNEMTDLLKQCKAWGDENQIYSSSSIKNGIITSSTDDGLLNNAGICDESIYCLCDMSIQGYYYPMPSDFNDNRLESNIKTYDFIAVNEASEHKTTALKFVKFLLGEEMQSSMLYFPVNRAAIEKRIDKVFHSVNLTEDYEKRKKEAIEKINSIGKVSTRSTYVQIILKEAKRCFRNEITAEQAAKEMAQKVEQYFKEQ